MYTHVGSGLFGNKPDPAPNTIILKVPETAGYTGVVPELLIEISKNPADSVFTANTYSIDEASRKLLLSTQAVWIRSSGHRMRIEFPNTHRFAQALRAPVSKMQLECKHLDVGNEAYTMTTRFPTISPPTPPASASTSNAPDTIRLIVKDAYSSYPDEAKVVIEISKNPADSVYNQDTYEIDENREEVKFRVKEWVYAKDYYDSKQDNTKIIKLPIASEFVNALVKAGKDGYDQTGKQKVITIKLECEGIGVHEQRQGLFSSNVTKRYVMRTRYLSDTESLASD